jgi:hypothetical protein
MRSTKFTMRRTAGVLSTLLLPAAVPMVAQAQQANSSAAAFGMGDNYTALARNADAIVWNMASLGLPGSKKFSLKLMGVNTNLAFSPIALTDFGGGGTLSRATRDAWLASVRADGTQRGEGTAGLNVLSMNIGRLGVQVSGLLTSRVDLNGDAMEALLYGNAGATGEPKTLAFAGSGLRAAGLVTAAAGFSIPLPSSAGVTQAIGVTGKFVVGAFGAMAQDGGTAVTPSNIDVRFPLAHTNEDNIGNAGSGVGADLSYVRQSGTTTIAATVHNVVNTFAWDGASMVARNGMLKFDGTNNSSDFDQRPFSSAPAAIKTALESYVFKPSISVGLARKLNSVTMVTADVRQQMGDDNAILLGPKTHVGAGLEYRGLGFLPIRGGAAYETNGYALSAGTQLELGPLSFGVSARYRNVSGASAVGVMFSGIELR